MLQVCGGGGGSGGGGGGVCVCVCRVCVWGVRCVGVYVCVFKACLTASGLTTCVRAAAITQRRLENPVG